jgi:hypothetical protein
MNNSMIDSDDSSGSPHSSPNNKFKSESELQAELEFLRKSIRELTLERDSVLQIQQLHMQQISDLKNENFQRESKMKEEQRIQEEQLSFLLSIQNNSNKVNDENSFNANISNMRKLGREVFISIAKRKEKSQAHRHTEEINTCETPACSMFNKISSRLFSSSMHGNNSNSNSTSSNHNME